MGRRAGAREAAGRRVVGRHPRRAHHSGPRRRSAALTHLAKRAALPRGALVLAGVALALAPAARAHAQQPAPAPTVARDDARFSFYDRGPYRPGIPKPDSLLGYPVGAQNTQYAEQQRT